ncbi:MAG: 2-oxoacid:acceptor oxidoreductase family protein [Spirochaetia bacterium]|nr:2-oxoacid:acceptor oxidoreductase family protein [Spirochaetia bacterium]
MKLFKKDDEKKGFKYPGYRAALDGNTAVIMCEREASDAAGAYPITPSTQMGEFWAIETANGHLNTSNKPLIFIEPEGEHAAAAVTAGLSMTGLRAINFSSGQGIAYMHESLYAAVGKRLPYILNIGCRAITKASLNVHAGHDDYHSIDDTGFFLLFAKNVQQAADLNIISHKIAELSLNPGGMGMDGFLTTHQIEHLKVPERKLIEEYLGRPDDIIDSPTPAQRMLYGATRRRIPELWDVDNPVMSGTVQNQDSYMQSVAAQRPYFFDHIEEIAEKAMQEFYELTGRAYSPVETYLVDDADYIFLGQGSVIPTAESVADYLRKTRKAKIGVVNMTMFRPFPGKAISAILKGKKGVTILERLDQPLAEDLPLMKEVRAALNKALENGRSGGKGPYEGYASYTSLQDLPPLYSSSFGMGSRDLQPEGLIGAYENMQPEGDNKKMFYLGVDFIREKAHSPKQQIHMETLEKEYPNVKKLSVRGSENPNLMPEGAITVRMHSVGGWGAMTTGKNLAMTLFDMLGYYVKANPKYGSEKKGQPTTYYLSVAPEPIKVNCEYIFVDVVLSPDPNVFKHSNPLTGLKKGGIFIIQSDLESPSKVWASIPKYYQKVIRENNYKVFYIDAFKIAREEATDPELQFRMQGIVFQGSFFAASDVMQSAGLNEDKLFKAIEVQLMDKFGSKGKRVVEDNMRVVRRGFTELFEIKESELQEETGEDKQEAAMPDAMKLIPASASVLTDIHRFWEQTGYFYKTGKGNDNLVDPFMGLSLIPAATGIYRDMSGIRGEFPVWVSENCTGCGKCWTVCPDTAIPGLVNDVKDVLDTAVKKAQKEGASFKFMQRAIRNVETKLKSLMAQAKEKDSVKDLIKEAIDDTIKSVKLNDSEKEELKKEFEAVENILLDFSFAITSPFYSAKEKSAKGSGGLLSVTVNPYTCKACMECVEVCGDEALYPVKQSEENLDMLKKNWDFWVDLPNTKPEYMRIENLEEGIGALETLLLDKQAYMSMVGGDGACLGCAEKTVIHLFTATITALMQARVSAHIEKIDGLIEGLKEQIKSALAVNVENTDTFEKAVDSLKDKEFTMSDLTKQLNPDNKPLDAEWLKEMTSLIKGLEKIKWKYTTGQTGNGRANTGFINATGCTSVWGSTFPLNPYPFPWTNHLFHDSPSMALGIFEGHMRKMGENFKLIRQAEEIVNNVMPNEREDFTYFKWENFTDEEFLLCPPVVAVGGDGAMYDIGFQNLSRLMMTGKPVKVMVVDTQVYSNTGGQACTSGFIGQISDMAWHGKVQQGKEEVRKEIGLIGMAHRTTYVLQGSQAHVAQMIEGFIEGLNIRRPAIFNLYTTCPPEHGVADDVATLQAKMALESRSYPLFKYNPDNGDTAAECFDLDGNPEMESDWPSYTLKYKDDDGQDAEMEIPMTFADFALTEGRFKKHFKKAPRETWDDDKMVPVEEYLDLDEDEKAEKFPFVWTVDKKNNLGRVIVSSAIVESTIERRQFWRMLKSIAGLDKEAVSEEAITKKVQSEMVEKFANSLYEMSTSGNGGENPVEIKKPE